MSQIARDFVDQWLTETTARWEKALQPKPPVWEDLEDIPRLPGNMSYADLIAEVRTRVGAPCKHERTVRVSGKCADMASMIFHDGTQHHGYVPKPDFGLGSGDYVRTIVCIGCHKVLNFDEAKYMEAHAEVQSEATSDEGKPLCRRRD